ncbi:small GTPase superfamily [Pelagophyceae sp. CCMP2097]|nr:small GTPase superfamily [Pelagophyceae sp. CCMP2097]|mmetsp:Transcript_19021/g.64232  ORF Transcript_19021/g.64232 Transcript_19021/m.64232 type:complete len:198 (-) Transcript_19021:24-617(-)
MRREAAPGAAPLYYVQRKVAMLGSRAVGKTTLATHFVAGRFVEAYEPTIESTLAKKVRFRRAHFHTEIVDTAGIDEHSGGLSRAASVGVHGYLLVYSVASRASFEKILFVNAALLRVQGQSPGVVRVLVATMIDVREQRQVSFDEGQALADRWRLPFVECSAKENINVSQVFTTLIKEIEKDTGFLDADSPAACAIN